jgi:hypothetical protein
MNKDKVREIEEFDLNDERSYWLRFKNSAWGLYVSKIGGSILFIKGAIYPESFDRLETKLNHGKTEIYLHTTDGYGSHCDYVGATENHEVAERWVNEVNLFYENRRKNQRATEAAN